MGKDKFYKFFEGYAPKVYIALLDDGRKVEYDMCRSLEYMASLSEQERMGSDIYVYIGTGVIYSIDGKKTTSGKCGFYKFREYKNPVEKLSFKLVNNDDGNIEIPLDSDEERKALFEGIEKLGYRFVSFEKNAGNKDE